MSAPELPQRIDHDAPVFVISVAAHLAGMHPQTLRTYDRMGLVSPRRTPKRGRRYSARDIGFSGSHKTKGSTWRAFGGSCTCRTTSMSSALESSS